MLAKLPVKVACRLGILDRWLVAQEPRRLCKRLDLVGFEHVVTLDEADDPLVVGVDLDGPWPVILWALAYYRGPLAVESAGDIDPRSVAALAKVGVTPIGRTFSGEATRLARLGDVTSAALRASATLDGEKFRVRFVPI